MSNQRGNSRKICALWLDASFQEALDLARKKIRMDRSTFIRHAIAKELKQLGVEFDEVHIYPPDRTGKGGRPPKKTK